MSRSKKPVGPGSILLGIVIGAVAFGALLWVLSAGEKAGLQWLAVGLLAFVLIWWITRLIRRRKRL